MATRKNQRTKKSRRLPAPGYIACRAEPGMFEGEYLVTFEAVDVDNPERKMSVQLLADEQDVVRQGENLPERGRPVPAFLRVEVLNTVGGLALLVLPQPAQPVGERAYVEADQLRERVPA
jgi:hypothetical protein